ncbi:chymotrypsin-1-like [Sabethes cyaneus]|uniref:chymotrypsin-1-like n=1 Tax=Sabethes cyaneus TaxID=53552 RepID=UPI00237E66E0|nr:chymotrypsin-1-like [Sabethes cyaneus]
MTNNPRLIDDHFAFLSADLSGRVIYGTDASIVEYPFAASLRRNNRHICGGSILTQYWILTAAHCLSRFTSPFELSIQVGRTTISRLVDSSVYQADRFVVHPWYDKENSLINDIALVKLMDPLEFSEMVQPVRLPPLCYEVEEPNSKVTVIGWGRTETGNISEILQKLHYFVIPNSVCSQLHSTWIKPTQICTAYPGPYKGDSGGPLMHQGLQVGIVSWGRKPLPGVLTKVSQYIKFIYMHTDLALDDVEFLPCFQEGL